METFSHPEGVHTVTEELQLIPSKYKSAPKARRKIIYTHSCVTDKIILLHTIVYLISCKFSTATDSHVFRLKCVIDSIFYIHSAWTFLWGHQTHSFVWGLHTVQILVFLSQKPIAEKLHTVLFSALIVSRSVASLSAVLLESTSSCLQLYLHVTSTTSSTRGRK